MPIYPGLRRKKRGLAWANSHFAPNGAGLIFFNIQPGIIKTNLRVEDTNASPTQAFKINPIQLR